MNGPLGPFARAFLAAMAAVGLLVPAGAFGAGSGGAPTAQAPVLQSTGLNPGSLDRIRSEEKKLLEMRQDLMRQIVKNEKLEQEISRDRKFSEKLKSREMQQLIQIYEKMAPRTAAAQINLMTEDLALVLISGMNPRKASRIMRYVDPKVAVRISSDLASRSVPSTDAKGSP